MKFKGLAAVAALMCVYGTANAQLSLSDAPAKQATPLLMAVGPKGGANWDVLSAIAAQVAESAGFTLLPVETTGSQLSARAVCKGVTVTYNGASTQIAAAIVGRDAATYIAHEYSDEIPAGCAGHYAVLSKGLFPYYLYAIVRADNPHSELSKLIDDAPATKPVRIAAGDAGSGAHVVMHNLIATHQAWRSKVTPTNDGDLIALSALDDGSVDVMLVFDAHKSAYINRQVGGSLTPDGKPKYKVIEIRPYDEFFSKSVDSQQRHLYQAVNISGGWFHDVRTIAADGILIVQKKTIDAMPGYWLTHKGIIAKLGQAVDRAEAGILAATETDPNWTPATTQH